ncbi:hypothetical protein FACS1894218_1420 [Bacilli bacterium]|nr:hypothetical protein FACS1894218_1420 [Bacilli bacterium]
MALLKIPCGQVKSYAQVAKMINHPKAARAVGTACKRNPFPILIPCHRVVCSKFLSTHNKQDVGFYSAGGKSKKVDLLIKENIHFN